MYVVIVVRKHAIQRHRRCVLLANNDVIVQLLARSQVYPPYTKGEQLKANEELCPVRLREAT